MDSKKLAAIISGLAARDVYHTGKRYVKSAISSKKSQRKSKPRRSPRPVYSDRVSYVGRPVGSGVCKRTPVDLTAGQVLDTRTLYSNDLTAILKAGSTNPVQRRQRDMINLRGFKINIRCGSLGGINESLLLHAAVIHDKGRADAGLTTVDPISSVDFFRGNGNSRAIDFSSTNLASSEFNNLAINSDLYVVLHRETKKIQRLDINSPRNESYVEMDMWVPIKRQVRYDNETDATNEEFATDGRCFLVWWLEGFEGYAAGASPQLSVASMDRYCITFWKEPMNC